MRFIAYLIERVTEVVTEIFPVTEQGCITVSEYFNYSHNVIVHISHMMYYIIKQLVNITYCTKVVTYDLEVFKERIVTSECQGTCSLQKLFDSLAHLIIILQSSLDLNESQGILQHCYVACAN